MFVFGEERERETSAPQQHRFDEPAKLSLSTVASLQSQLPFHLARSFYLAWLTPAAGVYCAIRQARCALLSVNRVGFTSGQEEQLISSALD